MAVHVAQIKREKYWYGCDRASQNMRISCTATVIQLSYLKLDSYKQTSSE